MRATAPWCIAVLKRESPGVRRRVGGDLVAEGLELGDGSLAGAVAVAPDEVVAAKILVVAVVGEQVPDDH
jgi:hypothetical protein